MIYYPFLLGFLIGLFPGYVIAYCHGYRYFKHELAKMQLWFMNLHEEKLNEFIERHPHGEDAR